MRYQPDMQGSLVFVGGQPLEEALATVGVDGTILGEGVGIVERESVIDGSRIVAGDRLLALASSGVHSNGFSLIRKIVEISGAHFDQPCGDGTLGPSLMTPTRIYVKNLLEFLRALTDRGSIDLRKDVPDAVPSGTPLAE